MLESGPNLKRGGDRPGKEWLVPALALGLCAVIELYFGRPYIIALFPISHPASPKARAMISAHQVILCLRLYAPDHNGRYPYKMRDVVQPGIITQANWEKIKNFEAAADGIPRPWITALDLDDSAPAELPLVISPVPTKEGFYIMGMSDGSLTTAHGKAEFDDVMERLKKYREAQPAKGVGAPTTAAP